MVFGRLLPREMSFFEFFEQHAALTLEGAKAFRDLVSQGANVSVSAKRIKEIEHEADTVTHRCVEALHKTFITPIDRNDVHRLISRMDDILDAVEAAAERITLYEVSEMTPEVRELAHILVKAADKVAVALKGLRDMKHAQPIMDACVDVNRLENEGDAILRIAVARLFRESKDDPITVIKWKEIYENLESATDRCEDVANIVEGIVLENA
jgi:predicted phosphate transport protein (TIGR00153 family)